MNSNKLVEVTVRKFVRPMRDVTESVKSSMTYLEDLNSLPNNCFKLGSNKTIYMPINFSGLYQADMSDVIKTDYNGNICFICQEYKFSTELDLVLKELKIPENCGIIKLEKIEFINLDSEPV